LTAIGGDWTAIGGDWDGSKANEVIGKKITSYECKKIERVFTRWILCLVLKINRYDYLSL